MLNAFANQLGEAGFCVSVSTVAEPLPTVELGRMVSNVSKYYEVLLPKVREAIAVGMKPFEKQLKVRGASMAAWSHTCVNHRTSLI